jgi:hypothetical protein
MRYLFDIHYHAFDLSHANLTAFIERMLYKPKKTNIFGKIASIAKAAFSQSAKLQEC